MNGFEVYRKYTKPKDFNAGDLYLLLLRNQKYTVNNIFLKTPTGKHKEIYLQAKILFNLRKKFFTRLFNKGIIKSDSDQSGIKYEESITERIKLRRQELDIIKEKAKNLNNDLFKKYFKYQTQAKCIILRVTQKTQKSTILQ